MKNEEFTTLMEIMELRKRLNHLYDIGIILEETYNDIVIQLEVYAYVLSNKEKIAEHIKEKLGEEVE